MGPFLGLLLSRFKVILVDPVASSEDWEGGGGGGGAEGGKRKLSDCQQLTSRHMQTRYASLVPDYYASLLIASFTRLFRILPFAEICYDDY